jgi:hypothetical protein
MGTELQTAWNSFNQVYNKFITDTSVGREFVERGLDESTTFYIRELPGNTIGEARTVNLNGQLQHQILLDQSFILEMMNPEDPVPGAIMSTLAHEAIHLFDNTLASYAQAGDTRINNNSVQEEFIAGIGGEAAAYEAYYPSLLGEIGEEDSLGRAYFNLDVATSQLYAWERGADGLSFNSRDEIGRIVLDLYRDHPDIYKIINDELAEVNSATRPHE